MLALAMAQLLKGQSPIDLRSLALVCWICTASSNPPPQCHVAIVLHLVFH